MRITREWLLLHRACCRGDAVDRFMAEKKSATIYELLKLKLSKEDKRWLLVHLLSKKTQREFAESCEKSAQKYVQKAYVISSRAYNEAAKYADYTTVDVDAAFNSSGNIGRLAIYAAYDAINGACCANKGEVESRRQFDWLKRHIEQ